MPNRNYRIMHHIFKLQKTFCLYSWYKFHRTLTMLPLMQQVHIGSSTPASITSCIFNMLKFTWFILCFAHFLLMQSLNILLVDQSITLLNKVMCVFGIKYTKPIKMKPIKMSKSGKGRCRRLQPKGSPLYYKIHYSHLVLKQKFSLAP